MGVATALGVRAPVDHNNNPLSVRETASAIARCGTAFQPAADKIARPIIDCLHERHRTKCELPVCTINTCHSFARRCPASIMVQVFLERYPKRELKGSWVAHGRSLFECSRWIGRIHSCAERAVQRYAIDMIRQIESFGEGLQPETFRELKASAEPG